LSQTKKNSLVESLTNTILGLLTSFIIQLIIYPLLDIDVKLTQNVIITFVFFLASVLRGYIIRRLFNKHSED
jgi:ABC-type polysaccharide transport system permease subunit